MNVTRRKTLLATGGILTLAGCIDSSDAGGNGNGNETENGDNNDETVEYDVFQLGPSPGRPLWRYGPDTGFISLIDSEDSRPWMVDDPTELDGLEEWLDETDFAESNVIYVETIGPNTCYSEIDISDVAIEDGEIVGTAEANDTSGDDEGCGEAETHPSALIRVTGEELPSMATLTVVDGRGDDSDVAADGLLVDPEFLPGTVVPPGDPVPVESLECDEEEFTRHWGPDSEVARGEAEDKDGEATFAMRVHAGQPSGGYDGVTDEESPEFERGDEVTVTMWNVSDEMHGTGNRHKYSLQVLTEDGWQDIRGASSDRAFEYTDEGVVHRPGEGFEWTFRMTEEGVIEDGHYHEDDLEVCPGLPAGRYRFAFHEAGDDPLAGEFDYIG